ncbi:MAG: class I SAM-dependent methyltransferase [Desulfarculaceae bacterium]|nr:class I SAM-dependent methyltransferase [Desulfarculaceae bacterium]MCF8074459.1 class I SAM-dependent methyltransferase [Desulfarculaceae bacterium]MCF8103699.1 class I SAM-dependent methyltransferase [Desulfarculaceae bacterium]MCF8118129.1 class I SAM-dependent methyltransferase [Desulfarculaceae bacterium]
MPALHQVFDQAAEGYDALRSRVIPCFQDFYGTIARLVPECPQGEPAVLDLGAGTGLVSAVVRAACPGSRILAVDESAGMLERLEERFAHDERVSTMVMDYASGNLPAGWDLIVSALSIHHLDDAGKKRLFARLFGRLKPGGWFINADLVQGSSQEVERGYQDAWREHLEASGIPREELDEIYQRMTYDRTSSLEAQLIWLRARGFVDVDCHYKYNNFAVYAGRRPGGPEATH